MNHRGHREIQEKKGEKVGFLRELRVLRGKKTPDK